MKNKRPIRIEGDVAYVELTQGYRAVLSAEDVCRVEAYSWRAQISNRTVYAYTADFSTGRRRNVAMHRLLMEFPVGMQVDHRDGDGLNNTRANLRLATAAQNQHNKMATKRNTSGFKGVFKARAKWKAEIKVGGKSVYLWTFDAPDTAAKAYAKASADLHGEFGRTA
jgi:hypothetical protein